MEKNPAKYPALLFVLAFCLLLILQSGLSAKLARQALDLWFSGMIPALLPFMILSGLLIQTGLSDQVAALFSPLLSPLFGLSGSCLYCLIIGFLGGFPLGARAVSQSLSEGRITGQEASLLLAFCNNIGPAYFTGYVLLLFPTKKPLAAVFCMYGIPFVYGLFLRYTRYRSLPFCVKSRAAGLFRRAQNSSGDDCPALSPDHRKSLQKRGLSVRNIPNALHASILSALDGITVLGGYMLFCNLLNLFPQVLLPAIASAVPSGFPLALPGETLSALPALCAPFLEITSGLLGLPQACRPFVYALLQFGGLSCIAQTYSSIRDTGLSLKEYLSHKTIQSLLAALFCLIVPF